MRPIAHTMKMKESVAAKAAMARLGSMTTSIDLRAENASNDATVPRVAR